MATAPAAPAAAQVDLEAEKRDLVHRLTLDKATSLAMARRQAGERERQQLALLEERDKQQRKLLSQAGQAEAELTRLRGELARTQQEREQLVDTLARQDSSFRAELDEYRRQVAALAAESSPQRQRALSRYADGDRVGAFPVLEALARAEESARETASRLRAAADFRSLANLASDMRDRGEKTTAQVLELWREAARRSPEDFWTWLQLARLHQDEIGGDNALAGRAAAKARRLAATPWEQSNALNEQAKAAIAAGDFAAARAAADDAVAVDRRRLAQAPADHAALQDLSVSLDWLAQVLKATGDYPGARRALDEALSLRQRLPDNASSRRGRTVSLVALGQLALDNYAFAEAAQKLSEAHAQASAALADAPNSPEAQRDLAVASRALGDALFQQGRQTDALQHYDQSVALMRRPAKADPGDRGARWTLAAHLQKQAQARGVRGDVAGALQAVDESLTLLRALAAANPGSANPLRNMIFPLGLRAILQKIGGDPAAARASQEERVQIARQLAAAAPTHEAMQLELADVLDDLASLLEEQGDLGGARARLDEALQTLSRSRLGPAQPQVIKTRAQIELHSARLALAHKDLPAARRHLESTLQWQARLQAEGRQGESIVGNRLQALALLAQVLADSGEARGARQRGEEREQIAREWATSAPRSPHAKPAWMMALMALGEMQLADKDLAGARRSFETALPPARQAVADTADQVSPQIGLWLVAMRAGDTCVQLADTGAASRHFAEAAQAGRATVSAQPKERQNHLMIADALTRLAELPGGENHWQAVADTLAHLRSAGLMTPDDQQRLGIVQQKIPTPGRRP